MRLLTCGLPFLLLLGCTDKPADTSVGTDDSSEPEDDSGDGDSDVDDTPVWEEARIEVSYTLTGVYPSGAGLYVVAQEGHSYVRSSGAWTAVSIDTDGEDLNDLWGSGADATLEMVAVGNAGNIATWTEGAWVVQDIGTANLEAVDGPASTNLLAVGWGGVFSNATGAWEYQDVVADVRMNDVWFDGSTGMAVGEDGGFAYYTGGIWTEDALASRVNLYSVSGLGAADIWAVGEDGVVLHWTGTTWEEIEPPTNVSLWAVEAISATEVYVVGNNGTAYVYDGATWTSLPTGVDNNLYRMAMGSSGVLWASGNRGMVVGYRK